MRSIRYEFVFCLFPYLLRKIWLRTQTATLCSASPSNNVLAFLPMVEYLREEYNKLFYNTSQLPKSRNSGISNLRSYILLFQCPCDSFFCGLSLLIFESWLLFWSPQDPLPVNPAECVQLFHFGLNIPFPGGFVQSWVNGNYSLILSIHHEVICLLYSPSLFSFSIWRSAVILKISHKKIFYVLVVLVIFLFFQKTEQ